MEKGQDAPNLSCLVTALNHVEKIFLRITGPGLISDVLYSTSEDVLISALSQEMENSME